MSDIIVSQNDDKMKQKFSFESRAEELQRKDETEQQVQSRNKKSPFKSFIQVSEENMAHLVVACQKQPSAVSVFLFLAQHMNKLNMVICSQKLLQERLEMSICTIKRAIKYLQDKGFVSIFKMGSYNGYILSNDLLWKSSKDKVNLCKFPATVLLTAGEMSEIQKLQQPLIEK